MADNITIPVNLRDKLIAVLNRSLSVDLFKIPEEQKAPRLADLGINFKAIDHALSMSLWLPGRGKFLFISPIGKRTELKEDKFKNIQDFTGPIFRATDAAKAAAKALKDGGSTTKGSDKILTETASAVRSVVSDWIMTHRQCIALSSIVDMFAERPSLTLNEDDAATLILTHIPYPVIDFSEKYEADFLEHFPQFPELLDLIAAGRFAPDRKKAYLFIHAVSDFGKGLLFGGNGAFTQLGVVTEVNEKGLDKMINAGNMGRTAREFTRSLVLLINECTRINNYTKQLENTLSVTTKFAITERCQMYTKIFTAADPVSGLVSETGVDEQIANRFGYFRVTEKIDDRPLFKKNPGLYVKRLKDIIAHRMNERINTYIALGEDESSRVASLALKAFHQKHGISKSFGVITDHYDEIRDAFYEHVYYDIAQKKIGEAFFKVKDGLLLTNPATWWKNFVYSYLAKRDGHDVHTLLRDRQIILGGDKSPYVPERKKSVKGVVIPLPPENIAVNIHRTAANN